MAALPHFASTDPAHDDPFDAGSRPDAARFCLWHPPAAALRGLVVHLHPFAEEMNKSRRMAALQARALAHAGLGVLQFDLLGCGDSAGDFGDATWERWQADALWAVQRLRGLAQARDGAAALSAPVWLWGHRVGALLAAQVADAAAAACGAPVNLLLWQPTGQGRTALQQFLRLKAAAEMLEGGAKGVTETLKRELAAQRSVEIAGYRLHPGLAAGLDAASLQPPQRAGRAVWLEVAAGPAPDLLPASRGAVERWRAAGWHVEAAAVSGPAFWQTTEIEDAPALVELGTRLLSA